MTPEGIKRWTRGVRDSMILGTGTFILFYETLVPPAPSPVLVGAGLVLVGIPPALALDLWREKG